MAINLKKLRAALRRNSRVKGIGADRALERAWVRYAVRYVNRIHRDLWREIEPTLKAMLPAKPAGATTDTALEVAFENALKRFSELDDLKARADAIYTRADGKQRERFRALLNRSIGVEFDDANTGPAVRRLVEQHVDDTVDLIKTVNIEHFDNFKQIIRQSISTNTDIVSLRAALKKAGGLDFPAWKVERIAVDQFLKLHGKITETRQTGAGVTHYFWRDAGDARVRPEHKKLNNERFAWSDPPSEGHPGEAIRCRCIADPDLSTVAVLALEQANWRETSPEQYEGIFRAT